MNARSPLLVVDRNRRNIELLEKFLGQNGYRVVAARSLDAIDQQIKANDDIALAIVDLTGFDRSIWDRCERLRLQGIPFLVLSPRQSAAVQQESLAYGARGVLVKPLVVRDLISLIHTMTSESA